MVGVGVGTVPLPPPQAVPATSIRLNINIAAVLATFIAPRSLGAGFGATALAQAPVLGAGA